MQFHIKEDGTVCIYKHAPTESNPYNAECYELYTDENGKLKARKVEGDS